MYPQFIFERKEEKCLFSSRNYHFTAVRYIPWACYRNVKYTLSSDVRVTLVGIRDCLSLS